MPEESGQRAPCDLSHLPAELEMWEGETLHFLGSFGNQAPPVRSTLAEFGRWRGAGLAFLFMAFSDRQ